MSNIIAALRLEVLVTNRLVRIALLVGWMSLIFYLSSIPDLQLSGSWAPFNLVVRKLAHMAEYAVLAVLWYVNVKDAKIAGILSVAYAMTDEVHQHFVPGRTGSGVDVLIDTVGVVIGLFVITWYTKKFSKKTTDMTVRTHSDEETKQIAQELVEQLEPGAVLALVGDLGAGKTTFVQGIAQALGITEAITSPTFVLLHSYDVPASGALDHFKTLYHLDLYRLETLDEVKNIGIEDVVADPHALTVIEWADRATTLLPPRTMWIEFGFVDDRVREIVY